MHESEPESKVHGPYAEKCMGQTYCVGAVRDWHAGRAGSSVVEAAQGQLVYKPDKSTRHHRHALTAGHGPQRANLTQENMSQQQQASEAYNKPGALKALPRGDDHFASSMGEALGWLDRA
eukprot:scaffold30357_cov52-Phaeocystis_antarctica.AAC.1